VGQSALAFIALWQKDGRSTGKSGNHMNYQEFIQAQVQELKSQVGSGHALNAVSGGVDSSVVTLLAHRALGAQLKTIFVENALMREGEPQKVVAVFARLGIPVEVVDARASFLGALKGLTDPEQKRQAITDTFYKQVFVSEARKWQAKFLFHGTILTDIEETVAGIKRQHNILTQLGIDTEEAYGYQVVEPLKTLRKDGVREVGKLLGLPDEVVHRIPFPGPALAARIVGEVTEARLATVRAATAIVEEELKGTGAFQFLAVLLNDYATGIRNNKREFGQIIVVRCIDSVDAREATVRELPWEMLHRLTRRITAIPGVNRCLYDLTPKPPATVEYI
jgi:GMP synthase (glutamine-hydrolysing)